jgi:geranylgeranyl reductase family protein
MKVWDAIVIGAGPAGCAAAYDLARAKRKVLLLDRSQFPRPKACAGGLTAKTVKALRYSVEPVIRQQMSRIRVERDHDHTAQLHRRADYCFMTVRDELDNYCLHQTISVGAEFRHIGAIQNIAQDESGVDLEVDGQVYRARFLVGADGVHSRVRQLTVSDTGWFWRAFALEAEVPYHAAKKQDLVFDFSPVRDGYGWIFPKADHLNVGLYSYNHAEKIDRSRLSAYLESRGISQPPTRVIGQYAGFGAADYSTPNTRVFLTGDAGGFVDPLTGEGIYFAIVSGQAAAAAILSDLAGDGPAHRHFARNTEALRKNLGIATRAARWFYSNLNEGFFYLSTPLLRSALLNAFADGIKLAGLASIVHKRIAHKQVGA